MSKYINIIGIVVFFILGLFSFGFSQESMTITTYYPSPYGSYRELRVQRMAIGDNYYGSSYCWPPDSCANQIDANADLVVEGNVGIGTMTPGSYKLNVNGSLYASSGYKPGGGAWSDSSDIRLKNNVKPIEGALGKMLKLRGVEFEWIEPEHAKLFPGPQMGMIAQDVENIFPQWVETDKNGYKILTFRGMEALTVEAIRQLQLENDELKAKNIELEARIKAIETKLNVGQ